VSNADKLAIYGGVPVRDLKRNPWPAWPQPSEQEWRTRLEPRLREVYLSAVEGLPGPTAKAFAQRFAEYCGTRYARLLPHGTDAIAAAVAAVLDLDGLADGGEVIIPNYTFIATASAPLDRRCTLAMVDIDPQSFTMDPQAFEAAIRPGRTQAVLPVHLLGHPANMPEITRIASRHGLAVIEDCAQAHGATCDGRPVGSLGDVGAFSFQSSKNLTCGEGGAVTTDNAEIDARIAAFMDVGRKPAGARWEYPRLGWNYRPSEYLAALLLERLEDLEAQTQRRSANARYLAEQLGQIPGVTPPRLMPWATRHAYHLYGMLVDVEWFGRHDRAQIVRALTAEGVPCSEGYTTPLSEQPALAHLRDKYPDAIRVCDCPNARWVCQRSVWLAQSMLLGDRQDMDDIVEAVAKVQRALAASPAQDRAEGRVQAASS